MVQEEVLGMAWGPGGDCPSSSVAHAMAHSLALPRSPCAGVEGLSLDMSSLVDIRDYVNKELTLRVHTDIGSQGTFFTDLNGFQVIPGARPWRPHGTEPGLDLLLSQAPGCVGMVVGFALMEKG